MNNYYGNRLVKFVSPQCDKVFSLELGGEEMELKDLIATILNISITDLKGIKDTHNNYYTFSSAIKNKQLTSSYSKYYTIVLGNSCNNNNDNYQIRQWSSGNKYYPIPIQQQQLQHQQTIESIKHKNNNPIMVYDQGNKCNQVLSQLLNGNYIDEKSIQRINQLLTEDNNQEVIQLLNSYNGYDMKILAEKIQSILNQEGGDSCNRSQLITYSDILDSVEDHFDNKRDIAVLKQLLSFDNESIIKVFQAYEEDCDILKLVDNLQQMASIYRNKLEANFYTPTSKIAKAEENQINNDKGISKQMVNVKDFILNNYNELIQFLSYELKAVLVYAKQQYDNYFQLFEIEGPLNENDNKTKSIKLIQKFYDDFMAKHVFLHLKREEIDEYHKILTDDNRNKELKKAFERFQSSLSVDELKDNIMKVIKSQMPQEKQKEKPLISLLINEPKTNNHKDESDKDGEYIINNKKKEKSTITLQYQNSVILSKRTNELDSPRDKESKKEKQSEDTLPSISINNNKKQQEFTKVINTLSIEEQYKSKILQLLSQNDPRVVKLFDNFAKNKMSLTKNSVLNVIQSLNESTKSKEDKVSKSEPNANANTNKTNTKAINKETPQVNTQSFESIIADLEKKKVISTGESSFIIKRYQNNDEMILSIFEVYKASDGELPDFIDSLQTFIAKHHAKSTNLLEPIGAKTPISITNTKKEMLNLFRSNEKSEMNKIKNKQKQIIALLLKENLIEQSNYDFFIMKIEAEDHIVSAVFEVFSVTRDHRDFVETLNLIKDIMYNKDSVSNDPLSHQKNILNELFEKSALNVNEREIIIEGLMQSEQTILSAIELFEAENDFDEAIDTLMIYVKNKLKKKKA